MKKIPSLDIYDASAGSGKTFTLVKEYVKKLLLVDNTDYYKKILAITFTNKAVGEMKKRVVDQLVTFSKFIPGEEPDDMQLLIAAEINQSPLQIQQKAKRILRHLLHDYSGFSVKTIDKFNHRIIRTFAKDLKLNSNFEVSLDADSLTEEAVDRLIAKVGQNKAITKYLLDYTYLQLSQDKAWNIRNAVIESAKLLNSETNKDSVEKLKAHDLASFESFAKKLKDNLDQRYKTAEEEAVAILNMLEGKGIEDTAFSNSYYPKFLRNVKKDPKSVSVKPSPNWQKQILEGSYPYYKKATSDADKQEIDSLKEILDAAFEVIKLCIDQAKVYQMVLNEILPMALINLVGNERSEIQKEQNILLVSDFNSLLHKQVRNQPAPFIYERLGERYRHFFIDEFQDTSQLQWENMLPLLDNVLSQEFDTGLPGSVMLVGDAKQSIYRWRGGNPDQFIGLTREDMPFQIEEEQKFIKHLDTNFRSCENIIAFNNTFFTHTAGILNNPTYKDLYILGNQQKTNKRKGGYVHIEKLDKPETDAGETYNSLQQERTVEIIKSLKEEEGISLSDICILVRYNSHGVIISEALAENNIPLISSETLLLKNSQEVNALIHALYMLLYPSEKEARVKLAYYLYTNLGIQQHKHDFLNELISKDSLHDFLSILAKYDVHIDYQATKEATLYQTFEILIKSLKIQQHNSAYLFSFMEFVYHFEQTQATTKHLFFEHWNEKSKKLSIPSAKQTDAVQIMTIHKAKGLEFPIVILPFSNGKLADLSRDRVWLPWEEDGSNFEEVYVAARDSLEDFNQDYNERYSTLLNTKILDELNNIYVAFTRASNELYILTDTYEASSKSMPFSKELENYVISQGGSLEEGETFTFGERSAQIKEQTPIEKDLLIEPEYTLTDTNLLDIVTAEMDLWERQILEAIEYGTQLHGIFEHIKTKQDIAVFFSKLDQQEVLNPEQRAKLLQTIQAVVAHDDLAHLFEEGCKVRTEMDIATADKQIRRIDRINFHDDGSVTLIDYKTGAPKDDDAKQVYIYAQALEGMGMLLKENLLVYINKNNIVVNKV